MIDVQCTTNIDAWKKKIWPNKFVAKPAIGEWVESLEDNIHERRIAKIIGITHCVEIIGSNINNSKYYSPYLKIELHSMAGNIPNS